MIFVSKVFLFHLGDEFRIHDLSYVYNKCNYIWRPFCSSKYFNNEKVKCIPIGYKSGVSYSTPNRLVLFFDGMSKNTQQKEIKIIITDPKYSLYL